MFCMVMLTLCIILAMAYVRINSVHSGQVPGKYYRLMTGYDVPDRILKFSRQVSNLFETPILFYIAGTLHIVLHTGSTLAVVAAWSYVGLRVVHAAIHLSYNYPVHRLAAYALSLFCIAAMWFTLVPYID